MTVRIKMSATSLLLLMAAACDMPKTPDMSAATGPVAIPADVCEQVRGGLEKLAQAGGIVYTAKGEATIDQEGWFQLEQANREQLEQLLAFHGACNSAEPPREQEVVIRNEGGTVLSQRVIETSVDPASIFKD